MATGRPVVEETWVEVLKNLDLDCLPKNPDLDFLLKAVMALVAIDFSSLGNGLAHKSDIPWQQPTKVHLIQFTKQFITKHNHSKNQHSGILIEQKLIQTLYI